MPALAIIDDDQDARDALTEFLRGHGFLAFGVARGEQALRFLGAVKVDLVITDLHMPEMSGDVLVTEIRARIPYADRLPIIMLSGDDLARRDGPHLFYVQKPPDPDELLETVTRLIAARRPAAGVTTA